MYEIVDFTMNMFQRMSYNFSLECLQKYNGTKQNKLEKYENNLFRPKVEVDPEKSLFQR